MPVMPFRYRCFTFFLFMLLLIHCMGCSPQKVQPTRPIRLLRQEKPVVLNFLTPYADPYHPIFPALNVAVLRFEANHPNISIHMIPLKETGAIPNLGLQKGKTPPDVATIDAKWLSDLIGQGGIEPLKARLSDEWLAGFDPQALQSCYEARVLFAVPWFRETQSKQNIVIISFALSMQKKEAIEFIQYLASDPQTLKELQKLGKYQPARKL